MPTLLLVDASSYLYRAFHAMPDLRNRAGEPTGAIYGVLNMLRRLRADFKADYLGCVFDARGKTFRDELYPAYKAQRPPMPGDLACQIEVLHAAIRALGWPLVSVAGVEADDVIGTLTRQAAQQGVESVVSTGDKDLAQLVGPRVTLINTMNNEKLDEAGVQAKFGVPPARIVDYLALVGDAVDNVPGVEGVGPKTAAKWIARYGSLDALLEHADDIHGAAGENLRRARGFLPTARRLLTVAAEVDLPVALEDLRPREPDRARLMELFSRLEFRGWLEQLGGQEGAGRAAQAEPAAGGDPLEVLRLAASRFAAHRDRCRGDRRRADERAARRHRVRGRAGALGLSPVRSPSSRCACAASRGAGARTAAALARISDTRQARARRQAWHARVRQPWHPARGSRRGHDAGVLCA